MIRKKAEQKAFRKEYEKPSKEPKWKMQIRK